MTLLPGYPAPAFKLPGDDGRWWGLPDLRGQAAVLYFYPLAHSRDCALEAMAFEVLLTDFAAAGARVLGISTDSLAQLARFRHAQGLTFPLLSDAGREVSRLYGARRSPWGLVGRAGRQTYLLDERGRVVHHWPQVDPAWHAQAVLDTLRRWRQGQAGAAPPTATLGA